MNFKPMEAVADAVLFEGYILYPYRPSAIKNRQRWNFGTLYPRAFAQAQTPQERWQFHAEILLEADEETKLSARVRFLQLTAPGAESGESWEAGFARSRTVEAISLTGLVTGVERTFDLTALSAEETEFAPTAFRERPRHGRLVMRAERLHDRLYRLHATLVNDSPAPQVESFSRRLVQDAAFTSAHLLLAVEGGAFVSLLEASTGARHGFESLCTGRSFSCARGGAW